MTVSLTSITWSILCIPILKSMLYCLIFVWFDLELFVSPVVILSDRILSIRYLTVLEFWQAHFKREVGFVFLCFLSLPLPGPEVPIKPWLWAACGFVVAVLASWRTSRRPLVSNPRVCLPTSRGRRESCCPHLVFLPISPGAHLHGELCAGLCLSRRDAHLVCEPSVVSITAACLEQRGCVRGRLRGAFSVGNAPLYLEGRSMRRLEGSGRKEPSLTILRGGMASPVPCAESGGAEGIVNPQPCGLRGGVWALKAGPSLGFTLAFGLIRWSAPLPLARPISPGPMSWAWRQRVGLGAGDLGLHGLSFGVTWRPSADVSESAWNEPRTC